MKSHASARSPLAIALLTIVVLSAVWSVPARALNCTGRYGTSCPSSPAPTVGADNWIYSVDYAGQRLSRTKSSQKGRSVDAAAQIEYEHAYTPTCYNASAPDVDGDFAAGNQCDNALTNAACPPGQLAMWDYRRVVGTAVWERQAAIACFGAVQTWTFPELAAELEPTFREYLEEHALTAQATVEPAAGGLVNLPVIVHTTAADDVTLDVTVPVAGRMEAAASYAWDFGGGPTADGVGRPYDGTSALDTSGYYVEHTYSDTGPKQVTLTTTWAATFTVAGFEIPLEAIELSDIEDVAIQSARAVLVAGD